MEHTGAQRDDGGAHERPPPWWPAVVLMLLLIMARIPDAFGDHRAHNDVDLFVGDQLRLGFARAFSLRYEGYLHAVPRLAAALAEWAGPAARQVFVGLGMLVGPCARPGWSGPSIGRSSPTTARA